MFHAAKNVHVAPAAMLKNIEGTLQVSDASAVSDTQVVDIEIDRGMAPDRLRSTGRATRLIWTLGGSFWYSRPVEIVYF